MFVLFQLDSEGSDESQEGEVDPLRLMADEVKRLHPNGISIEEAAAEENQTQRHKKRKAE